MDTDMDMDTDITTGVIRRVDDIEIYHIHTIKRLNNIHVNILFAIQKFISVQF